MTNITDAISDDARMDRFLARFLEEGSSAVVLGAGPEQKEKMAGNLIAQLFPTPLVQLNSDQLPAPEELATTLELAVTQGRVLLVTLNEAVQARFFRYLEQLIEERSLTLNKPQGWTQVSCHDDFKLLLCSPHPAAVFDSIPLKLRIGEFKGATPK